MSVITKRPSVRGLAAFTVRVSPDLKEQLDERAYAERKSVGKLVEELLIEVLKRQGEAKDTA